MPTKEPHGFWILMYNILFYGIIGAGLGLLTFQYGWHRPGNDESLEPFVLTSGYTVVIIGVLVCLLVALIRWRALEYDDGRRPKFTAGVVLVVIGAVMMLGALRPG